MFAQATTIKTHWLLLILGGVFLLWGLSLVLMRYLTRRRLLKTLAVQESLDNGLHPPPGERPEDDQALEVIRAYRRRYLLKLWPDTELSLKLINEMSVALVRDIARVYHPDEERPELKASLADVVSLYNRVGSRLAAWLEAFPMRQVKDVEIGTMLHYHELYRSVKEHPGYRFVKRHHLDKVVSWTWTLVNVANPWHWGRKAVFEGGKEAFSRLLLARIVDLVGEEALHLYGRRV